jgi:hypothetical protein
MTSPPPPILADARGRLAQAQADLLAALVAQAPPPPGFDPARIHVQARALLAKRRSIVAALRPDLVDLAGASFRDRFDTYARLTRRPASARDDAEAFARTLRASHAQSARSDRSLEAGS